VGVADGTVDGVKVGVLVGAAVRVKDSEAVEVGRDGLAVSVKAGVKVDVRGKAEIVGAIAVEVVQAANSRADKPTRNLFLISRPTPHAPRFTHPYLAALHTASSA
jgi:hypothetical protein